MILYNRNSKTLTVPTGLGNLNAGTSEERYEQGYQDGVAEGYQDGFDEGKTEGLTEGYDNGYTVGNQEGYDSGYTVGNQEGYTTGFDTGKAEGISEGYTDGYNVGKVDGAEEFEENLPTLTITANGTYNTPNKGVEVDVKAKYRYFDGSVDTEGLRAIGWDDDSIGYYADNGGSDHYAYTNDLYKVSEENKALYGEVTNDNIRNYKNNKDFVYCPYFDTSSRTYGGKLFYQFENLKVIPKLNTSNFGSTYAMFEDCKSLITVPLFDTSNVGKITASNAYMNNMFYGCSSITTVPLFDTSNCTSMSFMFTNCSSLTSVPQFDTSKVTNMYYMFGNCSNLTSLPQFNTQNVKNMSDMFSGCYLLTTIPPFDTSNVTNMNNMFGNCSNLTTVPALDTSNVTNMNFMFQNCTKLTSLPAFNVPKITNMSYVFYYEIPNLTDVGGWIGLKTNWNNSSGLAKLPNLSYQSCINILNGLYDFTGNGITPDSSQGQLKVHANFLTTVGDDINIGISKGWTITA